MKSWRTLWMARERLEEIVDNPERKHLFGFTGERRAPPQGTFLPST